MNKRVFLVADERPGVRGMSRSFTSIAFTQRDLSAVPDLLDPAVRTPFTWLLDAAEPVWVLPHCVLIGRHQKPANGITTRVSVARITLSRAAEHGRASEKPAQIMLFADAAETL